MNKCWKLLPIELFNYQILPCLKHNIKYNAVNSIGDGIREIFSSYMKNEALEPKESLNNRSFWG